MASNAEISIIETEQSPEATSKDLPTSGDTINIVIFGKVGTGKSSLVNGLIGRPVATEKASADAVTTKIECFTEKFDIKDASGDKNVITVNIWDTPGLSDPDMDDEEIEEYQTELAGYVNKADLVLYCVDMRGRLERSDVTELKELTDRTSPLVWKNTMIVLTFANRVVPEDPDVNPQEHFQAVLKTWNEKIRTQFKRKLTLSEEIICDFAIVPTGYRNKQPPDCVDWFSLFWGEAFRKVKECALLNLVAINSHRLTAEDTGIADEEPYRMKINIKEIIDNTTRKEKFIATLKSAVILWRVVWGHSIEHMWSALKYLETQALGRMESSKGSDQSSTEKSEGKRSESEPKMKG